MDGYGGEAYYKIEGIFVEGVKEVKSVPGTQEVHGHVDIFRVLS